jgi:endonuclease YncB( thermonuclease family)
MTARRSTKISKRKLTRLILLIISALLIWIFKGREAFEGLTQQPATPEGETVRVGAGQVRVIDGDTFEIAGRTIRILGIDTPEIAHPGHGYSEDQSYGPQAREAAERIVAAADSVEYRPYRRDAYGRLLAHVFVDGRLYAVEIIRAHLAWETVSLYGDNGFPDLAAQIMKAARQAGKPPFEPPWQWRRRRRQRSEPNVLLPLRDAEWSVCLLAG